MWIEVHIIQGNSIQKDYQINHELLQEKKGATSWSNLSRWSLLIISWKKQLSLSTFRKFHNPHHSEKLSALFHPNESSAAFSVRQYMKPLQINK